MQQTVRPTPLLLRKLLFIHKHAEKVHVAPCALTTAAMQISLPQFCDFTAGIAVADFIEIARHAAAVTLESGKLTYTYSTEIEGVCASITRTVDTFSLNYNIVLDDPSACVKFRPFPILSKDPLSIECRGSTCVVTSSGFIKTKHTVPVEVLEASGPVACRVRARDMRVVEDLEGECIMNFHTNAIVVYSLEKDSETAIFIELLC
ncbi:hypothetical protein PAPHI01_0104 [Pancytospora philotis]|nr:hypothetical protein PAPHI01_0104 [Pancytospora philotis]